MIITVPTPFFLIRTSNVLVEAEPELSVLILFRRFEPETFLTMFLRLINFVNVRRVFLF